MFGVDLLCGGVGVVVLLVVLVWLGVGDGVEQLCGLFGVIYCVVCFVGILVQVGGCCCMCQYGLFIGDIGQGDCVEYVEWMEWVVFVVGVGYGCVDEVKIEMGVVVYQDCVLVVVFFYCCMYWSEDVV